MLRYIEMKTRADLLCRRIELYRRILRDRVDAATSLHYLYEIMAAEEELAELLYSEQQEGGASTLQF